MTGIPNSCVRFVGGNRLPLREPTSRPKVYTCSGVNHRDEVTPAVIRPLQISMRFARSKHHKMNEVPQDARATLHFPTFLVLTFGAMLVWPMLGIAASYSMFDKISESVLLFGGLTALLLLPVYVILPLSEGLFGVAIIAIWLLTWIGGSFWFMPDSTRPRAHITAVAVLSGISLGQSCLGFLMILSKTV